MHRCGGSKGGELGLRSLVGEILIGVGSFYRGFHPINSCQTRTLPQLDSLLGLTCFVRIHSGEGFLPSVIALARCLGGRRLRFGELLLGQGGPLHALRKRLAGPRERRRNLGRSSWLAGRALGNG
jgi:hypothetical protein